MMKIVKFIQNQASPTYSYKEKSCKDMFILGRLFSGNFSCASYLPVWVENEKDGEDIWINGIRLEIQQNDILFKDMRSKEGEVAAELRMQKKWLIKLCSQWRKAVCKALITPKELTIIYENSEYRLKVTKKEFSFKAFIQKWSLKIGYPIFNEERNMEIVKFIKDRGRRTYSFIQNSNVEMYILGLFFEDHFFCFPSSYYDWTIKAQDGDILGGNCISLEVQHDDIVLKDMYPEEEEVPAAIKMKKKQFIKLCDEWLKILSNTFIRPEELAIVYENGDYRLEIIKKLFSFKAFMNRWFY